MNNKIYIETDRTIMRNLTVEDSMNFYNLNLDEDVLKYTGDEPFNTIEDAEEFLINYDQYKKFCVGRLAVIDKGSNEFIGWCGLKYSENKDEYDIGFRFFKKYWNKGFATETSLKNIEYGFNVLGLEKIVGRAVKKNIASAKVLEKIGLTYKNEFDFDGQKGVIYEITNDLYKISRTPTLARQKSRNFGYEKCLTRKLKISYRK